MTDSKSIAQYLAREVRNGTIRMDLHPGCIRLSEHKFQQVMIGRYGPNGITPFIYEKPRSVCLYFYHEEHQKYFLERMEELEKVDSIYIDPNGGVKGRLDVGCDDKTSLYKALDELGLIESATPQWYKDGRF